MRGNRIVLTFTWSSHCPSTTQTNTHFSKTVLVFTFGLLAPPTIMCLMFPTPTIWLLCEQWNKPRKRIDPDYCMWWTLQLFWVGNAVKQGARATSERLPSLSRLASTMLIVIVMKQCKDGAVIQYHGACSMDQNWTSRDLVGLGIN